MLISAIPVGGPISIEISIDNVSYEMPSSVVASKNGYILIAPFTSKGAVIDFSSYKDILFNLYTIDPATKNRVVWKNINIETITYKSSRFRKCYDLVHCLFNHFMFLAFFFIFHHLIHAETPTASMFSIVAVYGLFCKTSYSNVSRISSDLNFRST